MNKSLKKDVIPNGIHNTMNKKVFFIKNLICKLIKLFYLAI
jgi:hypothetical protein